MDTREFERIKNLIAKAQLENAKAQGVLDNIKEGWRKRYGTDDVEDIIKIHGDLSTKREELRKKMDELYDKLVQSYDWDSVQRELYG